MDLGLYVFAVDADLILRAISQAPRQRIAGRMVGRQFECCVTGGKMRVNAFDLKRQIDRACAHSVAQRLCRRSLERADIA